MMFAAIIDYVEDKEKVRTIFPAHRTYMRGLLDGGHLFAAGPFGDDRGALWVYEAETLGNAEALVKGDPFHAAGVFAGWRVCPLAYWSAKEHKGK